MADSRHNAKLRCLERYKPLKEVGYTRYFKLLEIIAERGGSGEGFKPAINLNDVFTDLAWIADELGIDRRSAKFTLDKLAEVHLIDPDQYWKNVIYVPQMVEYRDEWTSRKHRLNSRPTSESLPRDSSKSNSHQAETDPAESVKSHSQTKTPSRPNPNSAGKVKNSTPNVTSYGNSHVTDFEDEDSDTDPWRFLGIDRRRVPTKFLNEHGDFRDESNFESRFHCWFRKFTNDCKEDGDECTPAAFAEFALQESDDEEVEYPPVLLRRKKELEKGEW